MNQPTSKPTRKVTAAALSGAAATLVIWGFQTVFPDRSIPPGAESAIATLIMAAAAYLTPDA